MKVTCHLLYRSVLFGQWGFGADGQKGITVLLHGQPGTGKSLAAEALGYEVGKPLKVSYVLITVSEATYYVYVMIVLQGLIRILNLIECMEEYYFNFEKHAFSDKGHQSLNYKCYKNSKNANFKLDHAFH